MMSNGKSGLGVDNSKVVEFVRISLFLAPYYTTSCQWHGVVKQPFGTISLILGISTLWLSDHFSKNRATYLQYSVNEL